MRIFDILNMIYSLLAFYGNLPFGYVIKNSDKKVNAINKIKLIETKNRI